MKFLSVCSGIEAASMAWTPLGWEAVAFSEIEPFPCSLLAHHYPNTPNWGDMTKFQEWPDVSIDLLCGGTPCQSFSVAGLRKGLDDPRGNLMLTFGAIAAKYRPQWLVWENVPGVLSSNGGRDFGSFLGMLGQLGYGFAYKIFDAQYFGVAQRRRRVFVVGCLGDWHSAAAVLFERHSLQGHPAPRRQAGQEVAGTFGSRSTAGGGFGGDFETTGGLRAVEVAPTLDQRAGRSGETSFATSGGLVPEVAGTMKSRKDSGGWSNSVDHAAAGYMVPCATGVTIHGTDKTAKVASYTDIAGALRARTPGSQENSSTTVLMVSSQHAMVPEIVGSLSCNTGPNGHDAGNFACNQAVDAGHLIPLMHADISPALKARDHKGVSSDGDGDGAILVPMCAAFKGGQGSAAGGIGYAVELSPTLSSADSGSNRVPVLMAPIAFPERMSATQCASTKNLAPSMGALNPTAIAYTTKLHNTTSNNAGKIFEERTVALDANSPPPVLLTAMSVRRLTVTECEFLMGFPMGYTNVPHRGKPAADGNRYKALGNSWAVPNVRWIGRRIQAVDAIIKTTKKLEAA